MAEYGLGKLASMVAGKRKPCLTELGMDVLGTPADQVFRARLLLSSGTEDQ